MTGQQTLIARAALGVLAGASSFAALSSPRLQRLTAPRFDRVVTAAFLVSRLGLFSIIFLVFRLTPRGDIPAYYWTEARNVQEGLLPYRDFASSYAPLHPYLDSLTIALWHTPLVIILLAILIEAALLPLWLRFGRTLLAEQQLRTGALLYLASAVSLQFVTIDGQDTVIIGVLLTLALYHLAKQRTLFSGASVGTAVAAIKFLPLIYAPAFFLAIPRRWRWAAGFLLPVLAVYGAFTAMRLPIFTPLRLEGNIKSAGNLPFLVESVFGVTLPSRLWDALLLAVFAGIFLVVVRASRNSGAPARLRVIAFATAAVTLALLLFSKKSWPPYLMLSFFPICLLVDVRRRVQTLGFVFFSLVAVIEHSYWASLLHELTAQELHQGLLSGQPTYLVFLGLQILLAAGYGWLLAASVGRIASSPEATLPTETAPEPLAAASHS
ncbi:hypothetical protein [Edaphobacter aggregans]|uniref:hypothetical protein n=1 Tax=Edaphobacter aggregans TaxID=570835 RepID=UPI0005542B12|nr:hypothetical protein [Edaphobacter aggregans]